MITRAVFLFISLGLFSVKQGQPVSIHNTVKSGYTLDSGAYSVFTLKHTSRLSSVHEGGIFGGGFEVVDAIAIAGIGGLIYTGYQLGGEYDTFFHKMRYGLDLDGFHVIHLAQGLVYGMFRTQDSVRDFLWYWGAPEWFANPSDNLVVFENFTIAVFWEWLEWKVEPLPYDEIYGSWENARLNNWMDVIVSFYGCYATTDLPWIKNLLPNFAIVPIRIEDGILINMTMEI